MIKKKKTDMHIFKSCLLYFFKIFKFILIYLLHVLFVFKIEGIFGKEKVSPKVLKEVVFFIYSIDERYSCMNSHPTHHSYTQPIKK